MLTSATVAFGRIFLVFAQLGAAQKAKEGVVAQIEAVVPAQKSKKKPVVQDKGAVIGRIKKFTTVEQEREEQRTRDAEQAAVKLHMASAPKVNRRYVPPPPTHKFTAT